MEHDRFQKSHTLFIVGLLSLILSLGLFATSLYAFPNLVFGWHYNVPAVLHSVEVWLMDSYNFTESMSANVLILIIFLLAIFFAFIAYFCSNKIDNEIFSDEIELEKIQELDRTGFKLSNQTGFRLVIKLGLILLVFYLLVLFFEWSIRTEPAQIYDGKQYIQRQK